MLNPQDLEALGLSFRLAAWVTFLLLLICTPLAWWLSRTRSWLRVPAQALASMPLVLPPTVLGFYLLLLMSAQGPLGGLLLHMGLDPPVFTFQGLVIGSLFYSFPFVLNPLFTAFNSIPELTLEAAESLGAGKVDRFLSVVLPMSRQGILTAVVMGFAHTLGEFGVVLMLGGNLAGSTRVASIAIYDHVEALRYREAHGLAAVLVCLSFVMLLWVYWLNRSREENGSCV